MESKVWHSGHEGYSTGLVIWLEEGKQGVDRRWHVLSLCSKAHPEVVRSPRLAIVLSCAV